MQTSIINAIKEAYRSGQEDEALEPIIAVASPQSPQGRIKKGDYVIFYDIRGEREIQLTKSLTESDFKDFPVQEFLKLNFVTMIEYSSSLPVKVAFPSDGKIKNTLGEVLSMAKIPMVKIAESEKSVHIGYFMNGKREEPFPAETRCIVPSPEGITNYALTPEMSASQVTEKIISKINDPSYPFIVANLANVDVIGHIEDKSAILKAVRAVDKELGKIVRECESKGVTLIVTSDHGTVEEWLYPDGAVHTGHTKNHVPFIFADFSSEDPRNLQLESRGELSDIAPTLLELLRLKKPTEMTGKSLFLKDQKIEAKKKILLLILDGWGIRKEHYGNLIFEAETSHFDHLWSHFPHLELHAAGEAVGMPSQTVGNSEAGHLHIGAGRRILLDRVKIDNDIENGVFFQNKAFKWAMEGARKDKKSLHLLGIVSHYSSHGAIEHLFALLRMAKEIGSDRVYVHALIGRRGEMPESGARYIQKVEEMCRSYSVGEVVTVMGRFWALDREENWDRIEKAYRALVFGEGTPVLTK